MKRLLVALCIVLCMASSAFCIDPFKVNQGGFGPKIKGLQLGQKMSLLEIVSWGVTQGKLPFTMTLSEGEDDVSIWFEGQGSDFKSFALKEANGRYAKLNNFPGTLGDLLAEIEKIGFKSREFFNFVIILNDDMRIKRLLFSAEDFGAEQMTPQEFAQAFINAYGIPSLNGIGQNYWQYRNLSQGWKVDIGGRQVKVEPIITQSAFD